MRNTECVSLNCNDSFIFFSLKSTCRFTLSNSGLVYLLVKKKSKYPQEGLQLSVSKESALRFFTDDQV